MCYFYKKIKKQIPKTQQAELKELKDKLTQRINSMESKINYVKRQSSDEEFNDLFEGN